MGWFKAPRTKKVCIGCGAGFGLVKPNAPYCTRECRDKSERQKQQELPLHKPPERYDVV